MESPCTKISRFVVSRQQIIGGDPAQAAVPALDIRRGEQKSCPRFRVRPKQMNGPGKSRSNTRALPTSHCAGLFTLVADD